MQKQEFEILCDVDVIESVAVYGNSAEGYEVWVYGEGVKGSNSIQKARGGRRIWKTLDAAIGFVRDCGYYGQVQVDSGELGSEASS